MGMLAGRSAGSLRDPDPLAAGGGLGAPVTLTADLAARAIIAAARSYGDDPVRAYEAQRGVMRRGVTPAAEALADATGLSLSLVARIVGIREQNYYRARGTSGYEAARQAASRAIAYAGWRPEAVEVEPAGIAEDAEIDDPGADALPVIVETVAHPRTVGPVAARMQPPPPPPLGNPARMAQADRPARDLVLEALTERGPLNSQSLATICDRKEMAICAALSALDHEGRVVSRAVETGARRLVWELAEGWGA